MQFNRQIELIGIRHYRVYNTVKEGEIMCGNIFGYWGTHMMNSFGNGPSWWLLATFIILIIVLLGVLFSRGKQPRSLQNRPLDIIDELYAEGHIKKDEYLERKETLQK